MHRIVSIPPPTWVPPWPSGYRGAPPTNFWSASTLSNRQIAKNRFIIISHTLIILQKLFLPTQASLFPETDRPTPRWASPSITHQTPSITHSFELRYLLSLPPHASGCHWGYLGTQRKKLPATVVYHQPYTQSLTKPPTTAYHPTNMNNNADTNPPTAGDDNYQEPAQPGTSTNTNAQKLTPRRQARYDDLQRQMNEIRNSTSNGVPPPPPPNPPAPGFVTPMHNQARNNTDNTNTNNENYSTSIPSYAAAAATSPAAFVPPPPPGTGIVGGISGVQTASREIAAEREASLQQNQHRLDQESRRVLEGRGDTKRPAIIVKVRVIVSQAPEDLDLSYEALEKVMDALIIGMGFSLQQIDRAYLRRIPGLVKGTTTSVLSSISFLAFSPASTKAYTKPGFQFPHETFIHLENNLHSILKRQEIYQHLPGMPPGATHMKMTIPHVNAVSEQCVAYISGVQASTLLGENCRDCPQTSRFFTEDIVNSIKEQHFGSIGNEWVGINTYFDIAALVSVRQLRGDGHNILGLFINGDSDKATQLATAFRRDLVDTGKTTLVGGGLIPISFHNTFSFDGKIRVTDVQAINASAIITNEFKIIRGIRLNGAALTLPRKDMKFLAGSIPNCLGFLPSLQNGRTDPTYSCIVRISDANPNRSASAIASEITILYPQLTPTQYQSPAPPPRPAYGAAASGGSQGGIGGGRTASTGRGRGRGRGRAQTPQQSQPASQYRRRGVSSVPNRSSPAEQNFHAVKNPYNGIGGANIVYGHYHHNGVYESTDGISFPCHKAFATFAEAMDEMTSPDWYWWAESKEDFDRMNREAPLGSNNVTNPCRYIQESLQRNEHGGIRKGYKTRVEDFSKLPAEVRAGRQLSTDRYLASGHDMGASYNFQPGSFNTYEPSWSMERRLARAAAAGTTQHQQQATVDGTTAAAGAAATAAAVAEQQRQRAAAAAAGAEQQRQRAAAAAAAGAAAAGAAQQQQYMDGHHSGDSSYVGVEVPGAPTDDGDGGMSVVSNMASNISLGASSPQKKRRGHGGNAIAQHNVIQFTQHIDSSEEETNNFIQSTVAAVQAPTNIVIKTTSQAILTSSTLKSTFLALSTGEYTNAIARHIGNNLQGSVPRLASSFPDETLTIDAIDDTPTLDDTPPDNCRVTSCPYHNNGLTSFFHSQDGFAAATAHGTKFHSKLYQALPRDVLSSIGWYRCIDGCNELFFGSNAFDTHTSLCFVVQDQAAGGDNATAAIPPREDPKYATLYFTCPELRKDELDTLIKSGTSDADLFKVVLDWVAEDKAATAAGTNVNT